MRSPSLFIVGVFAASILSTPALARSTGISGVSGKPLADGSVTTCTKCHLAGPAAVPTVEISGPTSVMAGTTNQYTFIIRGGPAAIGGLNLSVDRAEAALELVENAGLKKLDGELTHSAAKAFTNGEVRFDFSMIAPGNGGLVTLYGAGNSANGDKGRPGDGVAATKLEVTVQVTDGTDAGVEEPDSGTPADAGSEVDAGTGTGSDPGHDHDHDEDKAGGCSSTGGAPLLMFVLGAAGLTLLRRRRA
jgi:MYXO-CTERM domain-containing protein